MIPLIITPKHLLASKPNLIAFVNEFVRWMVFAGQDLNSFQLDFFAHFPSLTIEAAEYIVSRNIRMLEMDTPTPGKDYYEIHHILLGNEIVIVEGLNNLSFLHKPGIRLQFSSRSF